MCLLIVGMEQRGKHFFINIGDKLDVATLEEAAVGELRDALASLRWQIWEQLPGEKRQDIPNDFYWKFIKELLAEWPFCTMELINGRVFRDYTDKELESIRIDLDRLRK